MTDKLLLSYIRKSIIEDERTSSPDRQRANISRVTPPDWVNRWYQDLDYSGQSDARPDWQRLLADLVDPTLNVGGVAAESLSRLYRNRADFEHLKQIILETGKELIIANMQGVNGQTASGRLLLNIQADVDQFWAEQTSESMRETIHTIVFEKGRHWGKTPFACDRDAGTLHLIPSKKSYWYNPASGQAGPLDDDEAPPAGSEIRRYHAALRAVFDLYTPERSMQDVSDLVNAAGWRYWGRRRDQARLFNREVVHDILSLWELYAGQLPPPRKGKARNRPTLAGGHDPILPVELCERAGATLRQRHTARGPGATKRSRVYLLSGIAFCGECGQGLAGQRSDKGKYYFYRHMYNKGDCSQRMAPVEELESIIVEMLDALFQAGPILEKCAARLREAFLETCVEDEALAADLEQKRREHERLLEGYLEGFISKADFIKRDAPLRAEIQRLEKESTGTKQADLDEVELFVQEVLSPENKLSYAKPEQLKVLIQAIIQRLDVLDKQVSNINLTPAALPLVELCRMWDGSSSISQSEWLARLAPAYDNQKFWWVQKVALPV